MRWPARPRQRLRFVEPCAVAYTSSYCNRARGWFRILQARFELVIHFAQNARRETRIVILQESVHGLSVALSERAERPRERLHHHVVPIADQEAADAKRASGIAGPSLRLHIERNGTHQRGAAP